MYIHNMTMEGIAVMEGMNVLDDDALAVSQYQPSDVNFEFLRWGLATRRELLDCSFTTL